MTPEPSADATAAEGTPAATAGDAERRLHPMSWLFVLLAQLRQFVVPLVALLVFKQRDDDGPWWPLIGVGVLVLVSLWRYFTYRYGVHGDALVVRSGLFERSVRVIPFARIHNVALQQSLLHRVFGVAEVRLESAGGKKPEAEMRVLKLSDAIALEALVRQRGHAPLAATATATADVGAPSSILLKLSPGEVLRLGLVSNRGLIVVGAGVAGLSQFNRRLLPNLFEQWGGAVFGWAGAHHFGASDYALALVSVFALGVLLLRLLSMVLALLQYHGFSLSEHGRRLTVERGLLARWRTSVSRRRIQAWTLREGLMHRLLARRSLEIDTAVAEDHRQHRALRELAPIAPAAACDALIEHLLPKARWSQLAWQPLPPRHWWRLLLPTLPVVLLVATGLAWWSPRWLGHWGLLALLWLPWAAFKARQHARRAAYAVGTEVIAVREGWWTRHWRLAEIDKLQVLQLRRSPLDRACGTATLWLDTAGAGALAPPLRIRFLPVTQARALHDSLAHTLARRRLRW